MRYRHSRATLAIGWRAFRMTARPDVHPARCPCTLHANYLREHERGRRRHLYGPGEFARVVSWSKCKASIAAFERGVKLAHGDRHQVNVICGRARCRARPPARHGIRPVEAELELIDS